MRSTRVGKQVRGEGMAYAEAKSRFFYEKESIGYVIIPHHDRCTRMQRMELLEILITYRLIYQTKGSHLR